MEAGEGKGKKTCGPEPGASVDSFCLISRKKKDGEKREEDAP